MTAVENSATLPAPVPPPQASNPQPLPVVVVTEAPGTSAGSTSPETKSDSAAADASSAPAPPADPYRKRAEAVGLHPDLSRALLSRLSATDYRNAAFAIDKALKTIPDDGDFVWPKSRKDGSAVFDVHFVPGAGHDCRRYVVTITKDRWSTTALPMERCGVKLAARGATKEKSIE
jgi:surface antigen